MSAPEVISPWRLTLPQAHALDAFCENGRSLGEAARVLGLHTESVRKVIRQATGQICDVGAFLPCEMTPSAVALLWAAWRKRQWTETLAA